MYFKEIRFPNLGIQLGDFGTGINIFGFEIKYYGIIITLGFLLGFLVAKQEAKRTNQDPELYLDYFLVMVIPAIIGARAYYVIFRWDYYSKNLLEIINIRNGGLAIYGGIIVAIITLFIFCKIRKTSFFLMTDTACMGLLIGQILGRWGNFFNREAFGGYTNSLFAMQIPLNEASYTTPEILEHLVEINGINYIQVHPTFLYESLWNLGVLIIIFLYRKRKKFNGELLFIYLFGYGLGRFWIEGLRTDQLTIGNTGIAISQILAILCVATSSIAIIYNRLKIKFSNDYI